MAEEKPTRNLMLLVTENCNLDCVYCYEHAKGKRKMSEKTALRVIDEELSAVETDRLVVIEVFGGEAFLNFDLIRKIDEHIKANYPEHRIVYETTTNGTKVHGEVQEWLRDNKERFEISLSLDGPQDMHDANRPLAGGGGSFDLIDKDFFIETWGSVPAKMTVSEETLPRMVEGIAYIDNLGFENDASLSIGTDWDNESSESVLVDQMERLVDYYIEHPDIPLCTMLNLDLRYILADYEPGFRFCKIGIDTVCYDVDGVAYPCQGFAPISIGDDAERFRRMGEADFELSDGYACKTCKFVRLCPNCYAANYQVTGDIQKVDTRFCRFNQLCILASAKVQFYRLMDKSNLTDDDRLVLKAIEIVQDYAGTIEA